MMTAVKGAAGTQAEDDGSFEGFLGVFQQGKR